MNEPLRAVRSERVVTPEGVRPATVLVDDGRITAVLDHHASLGDRPLVDIGQSALLPGLVDTHVHINEPGRTEWEGFRSATRAAAAGGVTTLVDMPLNSIPATTDVAALEAKRAAAEGQCFVDVGFWGGVVPGNADDLLPLVEAGVLGFKAFLVDSGVPEFAAVDEADLRPALSLLAEADRPLLVHAELPGPIEEAQRELAASGDPDQKRYATWLASRPRRAEDEAVALLVRLAKETGARVHVVHHSSADALPLLERACDDGLRLTAETCPHYLHFEAERIPSGATAFKCAPPIREAENKERLWEALGRGVIDAVVSDHSPCAPNLKLAEEGDFLAAWGGIAGLQLGLSVTWTEARARGHGIERLAEWMSAAPARLAGLSDRKGAIAVGRDADLVAWVPEGITVVTPDRLHDRHAVTPYAGERLGGVVLATWLRGQILHDHGTFIDDVPRGRLL